MSPLAQPEWNDPLDERNEIVADRNEVLAERNEVVAMPQPAPFEPRAEPQKSGLRELAEACAKYAAAVLKSSRRSLAGAGRQAGRRTAQEAERVVLKARARVDLAKREQPGRFLAVLACAGIAGGIALRIWRSRS